MQELSLKSGGGRNFGRGRNLGRVRYLDLQVLSQGDGALYLFRGAKGEAEVHKGHLGGQAQ